MNCSKCGAPLADGAKFCVSCGTPVQDTPVNPAPQAAQEQAPQQQKAAVDVKETVNNAADKLTEAVNKATKKNFSKNTVIGAVAGLAALVVLLLVIIIASIAGNAYKSPIKNFASGMKSGSEKKIATCFANKKDLDGDYDFVENFINDDLTRCDVKIYGKHKVTDKDEKEEIIERSFLNKFAEDDVKISKMYKVICHFDLKVDGEKECNTMEITVGKYKGKWYILSLY